MSTQPSQDLERLSIAIEDAEIAFWGTIADAYPEAIHGDYPPDLTIQMDEHLKYYVTKWLEYNADKPE